jgi:hypothetical protein
MTHFVASPAMRFIEALPAGWEVGWEPGRPATVQIRLQLLNHVVVLKDYGRRHSTTAPVVHALLKTLVSVDSQQLSEGGIASGGIDQCICLGNGYVFTHARH